MRKWGSVLAVVCAFVAGVGVLSASAQMASDPVVQTEPNAVIIQTPPAMVVQAPPPAVAVQATPWCAGAYSPVLGSNFAPCPAAALAVSAAPAAIVTTSPAPTSSAPTIVDID
jgi:hypothetical protein